jgi:hypothetical protein
VTGAATMTLTVLGRLADLFALTLLTTRLTAARITRPLSPRQPAT